MAVNTESSRHCPTTRMVSYSVGEGANSLVMNSIFAYAMIFYTDALGLNAIWAGWAMAAATIWDAITDPVMGHITDNTKSRFGKRHPYIFWGAVGMLISYYFLWDVPGVFKASNFSLFWYLMVVNLLLRTFITVFGIPFTALGFEICTDYAGRVKLQGIRNAVNMLANVLGPAMAWSIFFSNDTETQRAAAIESNYINMSMTFVIAAAACVIFVLWATRKYIRDSRNDLIEGNNLKGFLRDIKEIILDPNPRFVFAFLGIAVIGVALVSSLQMYLYEHFMRFAGWEKSIAHGGTMAACGLGGLFAGYVAGKVDKKRTVKYGVLLGVTSNFFLALMFLPGILKPGQTLTLGELELPLSFIVFTIPHALYWFGGGMIFPVATSMIADVSEMYELKTGINKDGAYAAIFSLAFKIAMSISMLVSGYVLVWIGFEEGIGVVQSKQTIWNLCFVTLIIGPIVSITALALIKFYPVTKDVLESYRKEKTIVIIKI
jgi:glycoside/pentoside/hexuronide:cation symporter, GPH family